MENRLTQLKSNFNDILDIRLNIKNIFDLLKIKINKLKFFYQEFIKRFGPRQDYIFMHNKLCSGIKMNFKSIW